MKKGYYVNSGSDEVDRINREMLIKAGCVAPYYEPSYSPKNRKSLIESSGVRFEDYLIVPNIINLGLTGKELIKLFENLINERIDIIGITDGFTLMDSNNVVKVIHEADVICSKRRKSGFASTKKRKSGGGAPKGVRDPIKFMEVKTKYLSGMTWDDIESTSGVKRGTISNWKKIWESEDKQNSSK